MVRPMAATMRRHGRHCQVGCSIVLVIVSLANAIDRYWHSMSAPVTTLKLSGFTTERQLLSANEVVALSTSAVLPLAFVIGSNGTPIARSAKTYAKFAREPSVLDMFLSGACLVMICPSFRWLDPGLKDSMLHTNASFVDVPGLRPDDSFVGRWDVESTKDVSLVYWCLPALANPSVEAATVMLRMTANGTSSSVTVRVPRAPYSAAPPDAHSPSVAACTLTRQLDHATTWAQYMRGIGVDTVYLYYNGRARDLDALNASQPWVRTLRGLVASGAVRLVAWDFDFYLDYGMRAFGTCQTAAMSACLWRHRHAHDWIGFPDEDEYPIISDPRVTLKALLAARASLGARCLLMAQTWARLLLAPGDAALSLGALSRASLRLRNASSGWSERTKYFLSTAAQPLTFYGHYSPVCPWRDCGQAAIAATGREADYCLSQSDGGFAHFTNLRPHHSTGGSAWGGDGGVWLESDGLRSMLGRGEPNGSSSRVADNDAVFRGNLRSAVAPVTSADT